MQYCFTRSYFLFLCYTNTGFKFNYSVLSNTPLHFHRVTIRARTYLYAATWSKYKIQHGHKICKLQYPFSKIFPFVQKKIFSVDNSS